MVRRLIGVEIVKFSVFKMLDWNNLNIADVIRSLDNYKQLKGFQHIALFTQHPRADKNGYIFDSSVDEKIFEDFYSPPPNYYGNSFTDYLFKRVEKRDKEREEYFSKWIKIPMSQLPDDLQLKDVCKRPCFAIAV